jgi:hypothetical protein
VRLYRAEGQGEQSGGVAVGDTGGEAQRDRRALGLGQRHHGLLEIEARVRIGSSHRLRDFGDEGLALAPPPGGAAARLEFPVGDPVEPQAKVRAAAKVVEAGPGGDENLLRQIVRLDGVAAQPAQEGAHGLLVRLDQ